MLQVNASYKFYFDGSAPLFKDTTYGMGWYIYAGDTPEGNVTAHQGSLCQAWGGLYRKASVGSSNTGWVKI